MGGMIAAAMAAFNGDRLGKVAMVPGSAGSPNSQQVRLLYTPPCWAWVRVTPVVGSHLGGCTLANIRGKCCCWRAGAVTFM